MMDRQIEALHHGCANCGASFKDRDRIITVYMVSSVLQCIGAFNDPLEIGIAGGQARNHWTHYDCEDHPLRSITLIPDIRTCLACRAKLNKQDMVIPVFQVIENDAVNPNDPTDLGIILADRVYFAHQNCRNKQLRSTQKNIIV